MEAVLAGRVREIAIAREVGDSVLYRLKPLVLSAQEG
jgi:hypothetical protein